MGSDVCLPGSFHFGWVWGRLKRIARKRKRQSILNFTKEENI